MYGTGVVLSGGGIKGMAHLGMIKALQEHQVAFDCIAGSSAGALTGALIAAGYSPEESMEFFKSAPIFSIYYYSRSKPGLLDSEKFRPLFEQYFPGDAFEALHQPLFVTTTNLETGTWQVHSSGPLINVLLASASLPPVFSPMLIDGAMHADGGIMNNFPLEPLKKTCAFVIGSYVHPISHIKGTEVKSSLQVAMRALELSRYAIVQTKLERCHFLFAPPGVETIGMLDRKAIDKAFKIGYEYACVQLPRLLQRMERRITNGLAAY
jgi:NTE family protein